MFAAPLKVSWIPLHERNQKHVVVEVDENDDAEDEGGKGSHRTHRQRLQATETNVVEEPSRGNESMIQEEALVQSNAPIETTVPKIEVAEESLQVERMAPRTSVLHEPIGTSQLQSGV